MSIIISRKEAKASGLKRYYTGKLCKHGHTSERKTHNGECVSCALRVTKNWRDNNKKHLSNYDAQSYHNNKPYHRAKRMRWHYNNPHRALAWSAARRARKRNATPKMSQEEKQRITDIYYRAWCYSQVEIWNFHVDHIIPLAKGGLHHPDNLQILEATINLQKGSRL